MRSGRYTSMSKTLYLAAGILLGISLVVYFVFHELQQPLYWGCALDGPVVKKTLLAEIESIGLKPEIILQYLHWPSRANQTTAPFPEESLNAIWDLGSLPCITWEPFYLENNQRVTVLTNDVLTGVYDAYLIAFAQAVKKWKHPVIIRFAHEMNLQQYHWGTAKEQPDLKNPLNYVGMYRYVVDLFKRERVHNVLWAFCPNADSVPEVLWNDPVMYDPGDNYIDILGMDGYNWGNTIPNSQWRTFEEIFAVLYKKLTSLYPDKPIFIFETASVKGDISQEQWIQEAIKVCQKWEITALIWFDVNKENDWRIHLPEAAKSAFTTKPSAQEWAEEQINQKAAKGY